MKTYEELLKVDPEQVAANLVRIKEELPLFYKRFKDEKVVWYHKINCWDKKPSGKIDQYPQSIYILRFKDRLNWVEGNNLILGTYYMIRNQEEMLKFHRLVKQDIAEYNANIDFEDKTNIDLIDSLDRFLGISTNTPNND